MKPRVSKECYSTESNKRTGKSLSCDAYTCQDSMCLTCVSLGSVSTHDKYIAQKEYYCSLQKHLPCRNTTIMTILSSSTHPHVVPKLYDFCGSQKEKFSRGIFFQIMKGTDSGWLQNKNDKKLHKSTTKIHTPAPKTFKPKSRFNLSFVWVMWSQHFTDSLCADNLLIIFLSGVAFKC